MMLILQMHIDVAELASLVKVCQHFTSDPSTSIFNRSTSQSIKVENLLAALIPLVVDIVFMQRTHPDMGNRFVFGLIQIDAATRTIQRHFVCSTVVNAWIVALFGEPWLKNLLKSIPIYLKHDEIASVDSAD